MSAFIRKWFLRFSKNIRTYRFTNIYSTAKIGKNCIIGSYTEIGDGVTIGDNCKVSAYVFIPKGVTIGNNVFIGPAVKFTNDKYPKAIGEWKVRKTIVEDGVSIGAGCTIICGIRISQGARIGAGAVVTKSVSKDTTVFGIPAREQRSKWSTFYGEEVK